MMDAFLQEFARIQPFQSSFRRTLLRRHLYTSFHVPPDLDIKVDFGPKGRQWVYDRTESGKGVHEPGLMKSLIALRRAAGPLKGRAFYDAGSLYGYVALMASAILLPEETVAIEMNPDSADIVSDNAALNMDFNVRVIQAGLTSEHTPKVPCLFQSFSLKIRPDPREVPDLKAAGFREALIDLTTLDTIVTERDIPPGVIKIDVEGSQMSILRGAERTLREARPILLIESDLPSAPNQDGATMADICDLLIGEFGYTIAVFDHRRWDTVPVVVDPAATRAAELEKNQLMVCLPGA